MAQHVMGWNHPTFCRPQLRRTARRLQCELNQVEIEQFTKTRNALVHRADFATSHQFTEFQNVLPIFDRLLMGLLERDHRSRISQPSSLAIRRTYVFFNSASLTGSSRYSVVAVSTRGASMM
jgi:hypothetical protein